VSAEAADFARALEMAADRTLGAPEPWL
jgi:hypothetical protein